MLGGVRRLGEGELREGRITGQLSIWTALHQWSIAGFGRRYERALLQLSDGGVLWYFTGCRHYPPPQQGCLGARPLLG